MKKTLLMKAGFFALVLLTGVFFSHVAKAEIFQTFDIVTDADDATGDSYCNPNFCYQEMSEINPGYLEQIILRSNYPTEYGPGVRQIQIEKAGVGVVGNYIQTNTTSPAHPFALFTSSTPLYIDDYTGHYTFTELTTYRWRGHTASSTYTNPIEEFDQSGYRTGPLTSKFPQAWDMFVRLTINTVTSSIVGFTTTTPLVCDFDSWEIWNFFTNDDYDTLTSEGDWTGQVQYGIFPDNLTYQDNYGGLGSISYPWTIPKSAPLQPGFAYYARAYICDTNVLADCDFSSGDYTHMVAQSDLWEFIIQNPADCNYQKTAVPTSQVPPPVTGMESVCSGDEFWCKFFEWAFKPSASTLDKFETLGDLLENKPPLGYYTAYKTELINLENSASSTPVGNLEMIKEFSFLQMVRSGLNMIFWVLFAVYVVIRIKKLVL